MLAAMHTHFASATFALATFFTVVIVGTLWKLLAFYGLSSRSETVRGLSRAALFQYN